MDEHKTLFDNNERYTQDGSKLDSIIYGALIHIMESFVSKGYKVREIAHIMSMVITDVECSTILGWNDPKRSYRNEDNSMLETKKDNV